MRIQTPRRTKAQPTRSSELKDWTTCRKRWYWSYFLGLQKRVESLTIRRGTIGHAGLAALDAGGNSSMITGSMHRVRDELAKTLVDVEYEGELLSLREDRTALDEMTEDVVRQCARYEAYYPRWDKVRGVEIPLMFRIPGARIPIHLTLDLLVDDDNELWIADRKFVKQFRTEEQFALDWQVKIYTMAARAHGYKVAGFIIDQIAPSPKKPKMNEKTPGMSRAKVGDWRTYEAALVENGLDPSDYLDVKAKLPDCSEFRRFKLYFNDDELLRFMSDLQAAIKEVSAVNKTIITCNDQLRCKTCHFQELCVEQAQGGDIDYLLNTAYMPRSDDSVYKYTEEGE